MTTSAPAMQEIDRALALRPDWERAALLKAEILAKRSPKEAIAYLELFLKTHPDAEGGDRHRWRSSTSSRSATPTRARCSSGFAATDKENLDYTFAVAALSVQMKDWKTAEAPVRGTEAGRLRRQRRGRALSRADRRGDRPLRAGLRALQQRCPKAIARGSPSSAPRRCSRSRARSTPRAATSPTCRP